MPGVPLHAPARRRELSAVGQASSAEPAICWRMRKTALTLTLCHTACCMPTVTFPAADEVNALVLDVGSLYVKGGYAGEDTPKALFPSVRATCTRLTRASGNSAGT